MAIAMIGPKFYAWDRNGKPLAFGKLYTYEARTNVPKPTYRSEDQVVENSNPVILNGEGYADVYLSGSYKMVLKDDKENEIWSSDPVSSSNSEEWVNCTVATYISPTAINIAGNQTNFYQPGRRVRLDNNTSEYSYSTIETSSYAGGFTSLTLIDAFVTTGIKEVCGSIIGPESRATDQVLNFPDLDKAKNSKLINVGDALNLKERVSGQEGGGMWDAVNSSSVVINGFNIVQSSANPDIALVLRVGDTLNVKQVGALGDDSSDDTLAIQAAMDLTENKILYIPEGTYRTSGILYPKKDCTVEFNGEIKFLDGLNPPPTSVLRLREPNITLLNPKLNGNRTGVVDPGGSGQYTVLAAYPFGGLEPENCRVIGGLIQEGVHNIFQGGGKNLIFRDCIFQKCGEHLVYVNETDGGGGTLGTKITFDSLRLIEPALQTTHAEAHYFQVRNSNDVFINNCFCSGAGSADVNEPTFGVLFEDSNDLIVTNSTFTDVTNKFLWINAGTANISNCEIVANSGVSEQAIANAAAGTLVTFSGCQTLGYRVNTELNADHARFIGCRFNQGARWDINCKASLDNCYFNQTVSNYNMLINSGGDVNVNNCTFETQSGWGMSADAGTNFTLSDCRIEGVGTINVGGVGSQAVITGNRIPEATSTSTIRVLAAQDSPVIIANNYLPLGKINDGAAGTVISANVEAP